MVTSVTMSSIAMATVVLSTTLLLVTLTHGYNLDFEYSLTKNGPPGSLFGFSVAEHLNDANKGKSETWILVGAPKANNTYLKKAYQETGTVFRCRSDDPSPKCLEEVKFDDAVVDSSNKAGEWMGVSLKSGGPYNDIVTCAHRNEYYGSGKKFRLLQGECYGRTKKFKKLGGAFSPCLGERIGDRPQDHSSYGQCQVGIGLDMLPEKFIPQGDDNSYTLVGAAGARWWSGEFFQKDMEQNTESKGILPKKIRDDIDLDGPNGNKLEYRSSYFGYAVTYGNFFNKKDLYVASGGPRHKHYGSVLIYRQLFETKKNEIVQHLPDNKTELTQIASGYGIALCSIDSNKDGVSELIVGAPFYLSLDSKERAEQGIVYVYVKSDKEEKLIRSGTLKGEDKSYARFGYAVANGGDVNLDGYEDLIVGAPREDGMGAVYIFYGSKNGFVQTNVQRIGAASVNSGLTDNVGLKGFGRSLGTGVDMDFNGYNDILIGAYLSNQVALLRTRPVIKIDAKLEFNPPKLDAGRPGCNLTIPSSCTFAKICLTVTEPSGQLKKKGKKVSVLYTVEADPIRGSLRNSRMVFNDNGKNKKSLRITSTVGEYKCQELGKVSLKFDKDGRIIEYPDVMFKVTYHLPYGEKDFEKPKRTNDEVVSLDDYPVLQQNMDKTGAEKMLFMKAELEFKRDCDECIPDLKLATDSELHTVRPAKGTYSFDIQLSNIGKDLAYSVVLELRLPSTLTLNNLKIAGEGQSRICQNNICSNIVTRLGKGEMRTITVFLSTTEFEKTYDPASQNNATIIVRSANKEERGTTANNELKLLFDLKVFADLRLHVIAGTQLSYEGKVMGESAMTTLEDIGPYIISKYVVTNGGPDNLKMANLTVRWPYQTRTGKHLLYLVELEGVKSMPDVTCATGTKVNVLNLQTDGTMSEIQRSQSHSPQPKVDTTASVAAKVKMNNQRVRRSATPEEPDTISVSQTRALELNCSTAQCIEIKCTITNLNMGASKTIAIRSMLWKPSLILDYPGEEVSVVSEGNVVMGVNESYISDPNPNNQQSHIRNNILPVTPAKRKEKIAVWQIGLAVAAGVILLALMIFGLYKVGFFRRSRTFDDSNGQDEKLIKGRKD